MNETAKQSQSPRCFEQGQASRAIPATQLLGAARVVVIEHKGERYELRLTRNDKLILTK